MVIWVHAHDQYQNINTSYSGVVSVVLISGQSVTGVGLVSISNGIGQRTITTRVAQSVQLGLSDVGSTGLNVQSQSTVIFRPG